MTNLDSLLKGRDVALSTKVRLVKAMVFSVVMYGCESWTIKKAEHRIDAFELWCWRRRLRVPWTSRRSNQSILKEISPEFSLKGLMLKLKLQCFGHLMWRKKKKEVAQLCPTLCEATDCSLPGSSVHGVFQARVLEWVVISFSRISSWPRDWTRVSNIVARHFTVWATRACDELTHLKDPDGGRSQDGWGTGRGDHFLPYKFIKRITERRANFREQLLIVAEVIRRPEKQPIVFERS